MKVLSIDLGSYSIKFYEAKIDGKKINFLSKQEVVIELIKQSLGPKESLLDIQTEIVSQFLQGKPVNGKIIYQIPNDFLTNRVITIPATSRKKAEAMIPFQLDENIPYPLSKTHYTKTLNIFGNSSIASIYITNKDNFDKYYEFLKSKKILPWYLTCEMAIFDSYFRRQKISGFSFVMDIGHESTKAYFFDGERVLSNHTSNVAGKIIDETIAQTYQISIPDAVIYKHENCFFLLEEQYEKVDKDQKDFALLMKQIFWPLILKIKQWMIGFKAQSGKNVEKIYLTGGTAKIKNIENFLMEALGVPVEILNPYPLIDPDKVGIEVKEKPSYALTYLMAQSLTDKQPPPNFLSGDYSIAPKNRISLYNLAFLTTRSTILLLILSLGFIFENFILTKEEKEIETKLITIFKYPALNFSDSEKRNLKKSPELVLASLNKKSKEIDKEIKNLQQLIKIYPIGSLKNLSSGLLIGQDTDLISYHFDGSGATAIFQGKNPQSIKDLFEKLKSFGIQDKMLKINSEKNELTFESSLKE